MLVDDHRNMHREYINARRPDTFVYKVGNYVWVRRQITSNKAKGAVGKLRFQQIGPWEITSIKPGGSYESRHCHKHTRRKLQTYHHTP